MTGESTRLICTQCRTRFEPTRDRHGFIHLTRDGDYAMRLAVACQCRRKTLKPEESRLAAPAIIKRNWLTPPVPREYVDWIIVREAGRWRRFARGVRRILARVRVVLFGRVVR